MMGNLREWWSVIAVMTLVLIALVIAAFHHTSARPRWSPLVSAEGKFRIDFPGTPAMTRQDSPREGAGTVTLTTYELHLLPYRATYLVSYADYPQTMVEQRNLLDETCDLFNGEMGGTVVDKTDITVGDYHGRDMNFNGLPGRVRQRVLMVDRRIYMLMAYPVRTETQKDIDRFFTSFTLMP